MATTVVAGTAGALAPSASADVRDGRAIEIFHGRNIVSVGGYPANTAVEVEVLRGEEVTGFATYTTNAEGFFEINHVGDGDCWQSPYTPNILPGDLVRTTVQGETTSDSSVTRDVFIEQDAEFLPGNVIRVTGHARGTAAAPIAGDDQVELRMNKVNRDNDWESSDPPGRPDLRLENVLPLPSMQPDGTFTHDFVVSADDWNDAKTAGIDISTVYLHGVTETAEATELTFYDGEPEATVGCPPLMPDDMTPPSQVTGLVATQPDVGTVVLDWAPATDNVGVTGYVVTRTNTETNAVSTFPAGTDTFYANIRVPNGRYSYTVHAVDAEGHQGARSAEVLVGIGVDAPPAAPTGVTATATGSSIALSWTAPATGTPAVSYQVSRGTTVVANAVTGTTYTDANRPVGTHTYTVRSRAADGTLSAASAPASAEVVTPPDTTAPVVGTLSGTRSGTTATLNWPPATDATGVTGYRVFRNGTQVGADLLATARTYADAALAQGTYSYTLRAFDAAGNLSTPSNAVSLTIDTTAPTVTAQNPAANATAVPVSSNVTATFNEAVQGVSATTVFLRAAGGTANVAAAVTYDAATRVATLNPTANLAASTQYTATLDGGAAAIRDSAGNALTDRTWSFITATPNVAPTVTARTPGANAASFGVAANITATFSEAVDGVNTSSFAVRPVATPGSAPLAGTVTRNGTTNQWILNPTANLAPDTEYRVTLTGGAAAIRDTQNAALTTTSWTFTTGPAPRVSARTPAANATAVSRTANVTATFSEPVQAVSGTTVALRNPAGAVISAVVSYNATTRVATLNPNATLAANTVYRVTLTGGPAAIRDRVNNPLVTVTWSFATGA